jgi:leader peptidase (prepilin peptidase)/N-methyltransferase
MEMVINMEWIIDAIVYTYIFLMGLFLGSFYNVVGIRIPEKRSLWGRSECPNCGHKLGWLELFPILGYIAIKGKCRECKGQVSIKYPLMELLTASIFLLSYIFFSENMVEYSLIVLFVSLMTIVTVSDSYYKIVPDIILIIFFLPILILRIWSGYMPWYEGVIGGVAAFIFLYLIMLYGKKRFGQDALGGGDIKLYILIGLFLGYQLVFLSLIFAALTGMIVSAIKKQKEGEHIAFVPYIYFGSMIAYYFGYQILDLYNSLF